MMYDRMSEWIRNAIITLFSVLMLAGGATLVLLLLYVIHHFVVKYW
jgi:hypothetical protein